MQNASPTSTKPGTEAAASIAAAGRQPCSSADGRPQLNDWRQPLVYTEEQRTAGWGGGAEQESIPEPI